MASVYKLDGLPSDLLNSPKEHQRRLKVDADTLVKKEFFYLGDGKTDYILETNVNTNLVVKKQFNWDGDTLVSIVPEVV